MLLKKKKKTLSNTRSKDTRTQQNMSSISAENVLTLLLEEPKLEEKRFMHLQSLVKVPWLAVPVSEWPPASKWLVVGKTLCTETWR